jgi:hypothetical protein
LACVVVHKLLAADMMVVVHTVGSIRVLAIESIHAFRSSTVTTFHPSVNQHGAAIASY